jgi:hypothetical protein
MVDEKDETGKGFAVRDRRRIFRDEPGRDEAGRDEAGRDGPARDAPGEAGSQGKEEEAGPAEDLPRDGEGSADLPPTFSGLLLSFASSGFVGLGLIPDPITREKKVDLQRASQAIAILEMLEEKTRGNLAAEEGEMLEGLLYDLRMRFVAVKTGRPMEGTP